MESYCKLVLRTAVLAVLFLVGVRSVWNSEYWLAGGFVAAAFGLPLYLCLGVWWRVAAVRRGADLERLATALEDEHELVRREAAKALSASGDPRAIHLLVRALDRGGWPNYPPTVNALAGFGTAAVEPLIRALDDRNETVRSNAARALGGIGDPRAAEPLARVLADEWVVSYSAGCSLAEIGAPAVGPTLDALRDASSAARARAAKVLGRLRDRRAVGPLIRALADEDGRVRVEVAEALGYLRDARAVEPLVKVLDDPESPARRSAAEALGHLGAAAEPALAALRRRVREHRTFRRAIRDIERAVRAGRPELIAAEPPAGTGTEPEAASAPEGRGTEPEAASPPEQRVPGR